MKNEGNGHVNDAHLKVAATLRSRAAGSQDESRCCVIHRVNREVNDARLLAFHDADGNVICSADARTNSTRREIDTMPNALIMLLVADSVSRVVIQETLEHGGYPVMAAGDLGTAVKRMSESAPDLLDI